MSKRSETKAAKRAAKEVEKKAADEAVEAAKAEAEAATGKTETQLKEKSAAQKKRDEEKAKKVYLKEPLTSIQSNALATIEEDIRTVRTRPNTTVADLQKWIPHWVKSLDELKI